MKYHWMYATQKREENFEADNLAGKISIQPSKIENIELPKTIWIYWDGNTPELVQRCIEVIQEKNQNFTVIQLNAKNVAEYCDAEYLNLSHVAPQHQADLIRLNLLYKYGGIWLDASTILNRDLNWIEHLMIDNKAELFSYYRSKNTTVPEFPVVENWLLASTKGNDFIKAWLDELMYANQVGAKNYIQEIKENDADHTSIFQRIGNLEYLYAYVACQKVMRKHLPSLVALDCDQNALMYQVRNKWVKEKILIDLAINYRPKTEPYLIKLARKERNYLCKYYAQRKFLDQSFLDF